MHKTSRCQPFKDNNPSSKCPWKSKEKATYYPDYYNPTPAQTKTCIRVGRRTKTSRSVRKEIVGVDVAYRLDGKDWGKILLAPLAGTSQSEELNLNSITTFSFLHEATRRTQIQKEIRIWEIMRRKNLNSNSWEGRPAISAGQGACYQPSLETNRDPHGRRKDLLLQAFTQAWT